MAHIIIHHEGVFNVYSTIVDAPLFDSGLTQAQLEQYIQQKQGETGMRDLPQRIERARAKGTSGHIAQSLKSEVSCNRAGPKETNMALSEFINTYLVIKK